MSDIIGTPLFTDRVRHLETTDTDHADTWNVIHEPLIDNDVYLKQRLDSLLPSGTRMLFAQPSAPPGWTQLADPLLDNRMLRLVSGSGGGSGGTHSPILMNVVPAHTHGYSGNTGVEGSDHTHPINFNTSLESSNHAHSFSGTTGTESTQHSHQVSIDTLIADTPDGSGTYLAEGSGGRDVPAFTHAVDSGVESTTHTHDFAGATGLANASHVHAVIGDTGGLSAQHIHGYAGVTDGGSSSTDWAPRYFDVIICQVN